MALGSSDITHRAAKIEAGLSGVNDNLNSAIVGFATPNAYSFFGPGALTVDVNKDIVITPPATDEKLGDMRLYNHTASAPSGGPGVTHKWGPGGTTTSFTVAVSVQALNHGSFAVPPTHVRTNFYLSTTDRTNETNLHHGQTTALVTTTGHTIPTNHTRASSSVNKMSNPQQVNITAFPVTSLSKPDTVYIDAFLCNSSGARLVNLPNVAGGYSTLNIDEYAYPLMKAGGSISSKDLPSGNSPAGNPWSVTGSRFQIYSASTPKCSASTVNQTNGSSTYGFYWTVILGDSLGNFYAAGVTGITLRTYLDDGSQSHDQEIENAVTNTDPTTQKNESGTISGASFSYDDEWQVYYDNSSSGADITYNGTYSAC